MQTDVTEEPNQPVQPGQPEQPEQPAKPEQANSNVYLGIVGMTMFSDIAGAMDLPADQTGVLVIEVQQDSPADEAGLRAGSEQFTLQGETVTIGGDVITEFNGQSINSIDELVSRIQSSAAGDEVTLTILRGGEQMEVQAVLAERTN